MRVLVLGAGFGGLELTTRLSDELGDAVEVVLIDKAEGFAFGFSRLDVMFGRLVADAVVHPYRDLVKPGVRFVQTTIRSIDPGQRRVETDAGSFDADVMVVALGADLDPAATPGLVEGGYEFYSMPGALAVRDVLAAFDGGRVVVGVTSTPFKCPPAPSEVALLMHDYLTDRAGETGRRSRWSRPWARPSRRHRAPLKRYWLLLPNGTSACIPASWCANSTRPGKWPGWPMAVKSPTTCSSACRCTRHQRWSRHQGCAPTAGSR